MSLFTGKCIHGNKRTQLVISDNIIESVHNRCHDDPTPPPDVTGFIVVDPTNPFSDNESPDNQAHPSNKPID